MATMLHIGRIGVGIRHNRGFVVDRPQGSGDVVFLHFLTPIRLLSAAGRRVEKPGACILYTPPHPQWYTAVADGFNHDWFHLSGKDMLTVLKRYGLPRNTVFHPPHTEFIAGDLSEIQREKWRGDTHWVAAVALRLHLFFLRLSRATQDAEDGGRTAYKAGLLEIFRALRVRLHEDPSHPWNVPAMAKEMQLSVSRFAVLYHEFFGVSPAQELIKLRLDKAGWLLMSTNMRVADIAYESGFRNIHYFSRLFRRRLGCTPRDYSRRHV
jgi:AraC-like DNA-binding protein